MRAIAALALASAALALACGGRVDEGASVVQDDAMAGDATAYDVSLDSGPGVFETGPVLPPSDPGDARTLRSP